MTMNVEALRPVLTGKAPNAKEAILAFINYRASQNEAQLQAFTAEQLRLYVQINVIGRISPSSTDRVLRQLRQQKKLDYLVLNRGKSLYRAVPIGTTNS